MDKVAEFFLETQQRILNNSSNSELLEAAAKFNVESNKAKYSYNFKWMGRPVIQYPQDLLAMQEIIWDIKPELIIETGVAHGGSLIFYASMLELIGHGTVIGIDIDIRAHNRIEIESHRMYKRIELVQGSSISPEIVERVHNKSAGKKSVLVVLDSNHTYEHVMAELKAYSPLVSLQSYIVVFDTIVEQLPSDYLPDHKRPWGIGNNPMTAVNEFIQTNQDFIIDESIDSKLLISVAPRGYLKRIR